MLEVFSRRTPLLVCYILAIACFRNNYVAAIRPFPMTVRDSSEDTHSALKNTCQCDCCYNVGNNGHMECVSPLATSYDTEVCSLCNIADCAARFPVSCGQVSSIVTADCIVRHGWIISVVPVFFVVLAIGLLVYGVFIRNFDGYHRTQPATNPAPPLLEVLPAQYATFSRTSRSAVPQGNQPWVSPKYEGQSVPSLSLPAIPEVPETPDTYEEQTGSPSSAPCDGLGSTSSQDSEANSTRGAELVNSNGSSEVGEEIESKEGNETTEEEVVPTAYDNVGQYRDRDESLSADIVPPTEVVGETEDRADYDIASLEGFMASNPEYSSPAGEESDLSSSLNAEQKYDSVYSSNTGSELAAAKKAPIASSSLMQLGRHNPDDVFSIGPDRIDECHNEKIASTSTQIDSSSGSGGSKLSAQHLDSAEEVEQSGDEIVWTGTATLSQAETNTDTGEGTAEAESPGSDKSNYTLPQEIGDTRTAAENQKTNEISSSPAGHLDLSSKPRGTEAFSLDMDSEDVAEDNESLNPDLIPGADISGANISGGEVSEPNVDDLETQDEDVSAESLSSHDGLEKNATGSEIVSTDDADEDGSCDSFRTTLGEGGAHYPIAFVGVKDEEVHSYESNDIMSDEVDQQSFVEILPTFSFMPSDEPGTTASSYEHRTESATTREVHGAGFASPLGLSAELRDGPSTSSSKLSPEGSGSERSSGAHARDEECVESFPGYDFDPNPGYTSDSHELEVASETEAERVGNEAAAEISHDLSSNIHVPGEGAPGMSFLLDTYASDNISTISGLNESSRELSAETEEDSDLDEPLLKTGED